MKIIRNSKFLITAEITAEDMEIYSLTYEKLDYTEHRTRKMLADVVKLIRHQLKTDFILKSGTVIEVTPTQNGGCKIVFTTVKTEKIIRNTSLPLS